MLRNPGSWSILLLLAACAGPSTAPTAQISTALDEQQLLTFPSPPSRCNANISGWLVTDVIDNAALGGAGKLSCLFQYDLRSSVPLNVAVQNLDDYAQAVGATRIPDKLGVLPFGLSDTLPPLADQRFRQQVGRLHYLANASAKPVWLTLLDTAPTNDGDGDTGSASAFKHGEALANLARDLLCRGISPGPAVTPGCPITVRTRQALGRIYSDGAVTLEYGSVLDLYLALNAELNEWEASGAPSQRPKLVLNLSVGWHPSLGEATDHDATGAVFQQLLRARCEGVEILAAGGNIGGADKQNELDKGLLLPAAWMKFPADPPQCATFGYPTDQLPLSGVPLLYAVSAAGADGLPLALTRPGGLSGLLAPGDHAVAYDASGLAYSPLTGTSVSAIVASSGFAVRLHSNPEITPADLWNKLLQKQDLVELNGDAMEANLDASDSSTLTDALSPLQRVGICPPVLSQEPTPGYFCAVQPQAAVLLDAGTSTGPYRVAQAFHATNGQYGAQSFWCPTGKFLGWLPGYSLSSYGLSACTDTEKLDTQGEDVARLQKLFPGIDGINWVFPQPVWSDCPACIMARSSGSLLLFLDGKASSGTLAETQLEVDYRSASGAVLTEIVPLKLWSHATTVNFRLDGTFACLATGNQIVGARLVHRHGDTVNVSALLLDASLYP